MIGDLLNEHYHHNISLYDLLLCIQSLHVLMYGFITYFAVDNLKGNIGNFILHSLHTLTIASHGAMSYLDTRHNFRHIISDFTAVSHLTMQLAARGGRTVGASKCH